MFTKHSVNLTLPATIVIVISEILSSLLAKEKSVSLVLILAKKLKMVKTEPQDGFSVEKVLDKRITGEGIIEYLLKWRGYSE